jgi:hypothetical protein
VASPNSPLRRKASPQPPPGEGALDADCIELFIGFKNILKTFLKISAYKNLNL